MNIISLPNTTVFSYNLDTHLELNLIYKRQFLISSQKKTRSPSSKICAAYIDKI